jgi:ceramide glucosyltransferase
MVPIIFGTLAFLSVAINLWQFIAARCFPLHQRSSKTDFTPGLSLLKPLKGADTETEGCLASWFAQDYPGPLQILFAVGDEHDPVVPIVRKLMSLHPNVDAELVVCAEKLGINSKVSKLIQASRKLRHEFVVVSDADVAAPPDFLLQTVQAQSGAGELFLHSGESFHPRDALGSDCRQCRFLEPGIAGAHH